MKTKKTKIRRKTRKTKKSRPKKYKIQKGGNSTNVPNVEKFFSFARMIYDFYEKNGGATDKKDEYIKSLMYVFYLTNKTIESFTSYSDIKDIEKRLGIVNDNRVGNLDMKIESIKENYATILSKINKNLRLYKKTDIKDVMITYEGFDDKVDNGYDKKIEDSIKIIKVDWKKKKEFIYEDKEDDIFDTEYDYIYCQIDNISSENEEDVYTDAIIKYDKYNTEQAQDIYLEDLKTDPELYKDFLLEVYCFTDDDNDIKKNESRENETDISSYIRNKFGNRLLNLRGKQIVLKLNDPNQNQSNIKRDWNTTEDEFPSENFIKIWSFEIQ
jgi:hypothetical protein